MKRSRIILGMFTAFVLSFGLLAVAPGIAGADAIEMPLTTGAGADPALQTQATAYPIWVGSKQVTSANKSNVLGDKGKSVKYSPSTNTLTLNNASIKGASVSAQGGYTYYRGIYSRHASGLTIVLKGANTVSVSGKGTASSYGIDAASAGESKNLVIKGSGSLKVKAGAAGYYSYGIVCKNLSIQGSAKVTACGGASKSVYSNNGVAGSYGVFAKGALSLSGSAKLTASGKTRAMNTAATYAGNYTPQVKAGASSKSITVSKKKPVAGVYTSYKYVSISKVASKSDSSKTPAKMTIASVTPFSGGLSVKWKVLTKKCTGYQYQLKNTATGKTWAYSTPRTHNGKAVNGTTFRNLIAGTRYTVRVRACNESGGKVYFGAWSAAKSGVPL